MYENHSNGQILPILYILTHTQIDCGFQFPYISVVCSSSNYSSIYLSHYNILLVWWTHSNVDYTWIISIELYHIAQILAGENFGKFGETNVICQYLHSQIPDSLK